MRTKLLPLFTSILLFPTISTALPCKFKAGDVVSYNKRFQKEFFGYCKGIVVRCYDNDEALAPMYKVSDWMCGSKLFNDLTDIYAEYEIEKYTTKK